MGLIKQRGSIIIHYFLLSKKSVYLVEETITMSHTVSTMAIYTPKDTWVVSWALLVEGSLPTAKTMV